MTKRNRIQLPDGSWTRRSYTAAEAVHILAFELARATETPGRPVPPSAEVVRAKERAIAAERAGRVAQIERRKMRERKG
jgi:hypothetical protein